MDFLVFGFNVTMILAVVVSAVYIFSMKKKFAFLRAKSTEIQMVQSVGGFFWVVGFSLKIGTFSRGKMGKGISAWTSPMLWCNVWNFQVAINMGYALWSSCILLRLIRMLWIFKLKRSSITIFGRHLSFGKRKDLYGLLLMLISPFWIWYGFILIPFGAARLKRIGGEAVCLYSSDVWKWLDHLFFFSTWLVMIVLTYIVRDVRDDLGENKAMQRSVKISLSTLSSCAIVEILSIDGLWIGRSLVSVAITYTVCSFFFLQNVQTLVKILSNDKTMPPGVARAIEQVLHQAQMDLEGGSASSTMKDATTMKSDVHGDTTHSNGEIDDFTAPSRLRRRNHALTAEQKAQRAIFNRSVLGDDDKSSAGIDMDAGDEI